MEHVRTVKEPKQSIPTFAETVALLMQPENQHVKFNVDVKPQNDPDRLFSLMHTIISAHDGWETKLAPRILLGLWHPRFLPAAKSHLPYCRRSYIGCDTTLARKYFWADCDAFSMHFDSLTSGDGEKFRKECKAAGKQLMVWTVNEPHYMMEVRACCQYRYKFSDYAPQAVRWEVDAILTDTTKTWLDMRQALNVDYDKIGAQYSRFFLWTTWKFYAPILYLRNHLIQLRLERIAGPFDVVTQGPITVN
ncbi:hypothetical protein PTI98_005344 [Pleurotus ostreatus]|nr:hypothetical protein PTI98_005344 [Pleurotus ostreatus]